VLRHRLDDLHFQITPGIYNRKRKPKPTKGSRAAPATDDDDELEWNRIA